jgi:Rhodopirellula transposase DDE domain
VVEPFDLSITVCHYPTGASKWNPIEHRLFSENSKHWAGQPLASYRTILRLINQTTTQTGLRVRATLVTRRYATGQKISDLQMRKIACQKHRILPDWNYTLSPLENRAQAFGIRISFVIRHSSFVIPPAPVPSCQRPTPNPSLRHEHRTLRL